jgi:hypothetical protein
MFAFGILSCAKASGPRPEGAEVNNVGRDVAVVPESVCDNTPDVDLSGLSI